MKRIILIVLFATGGGNLTAANSVDEQITRIMNAPQGEKAALMNQFKTSLAKLNEQERREAIQRLQRGMNPEGKGMNHTQHLPMQQQMRSNVQHQRSMGNMNTHNRR
ncbi:MAG TPA: hypothetical protein VFX57_07730 [Sulfuricurvum sp.]|nr:hypothetical protein [Sulfuricurvum sp.]